MASVPTPQNTRPPIVAVMGHVDHGKTTLLDFIRKTNVAAREAGGITQAIGAYEIEHAGRAITFIDTPGHEAFSNMRGYGSQVADIAILVVAADDSVKPQTKDALRHIQQAKLPFIVAINKVDKPGANIEKVKQDLTQIGVFLEGYGGDVSWSAISAKVGTGIHELLDHLLLMADIASFTCDPTAPATGVVLSARPDARRGLIVGVVVQEGTLRAGDRIGTPTALGKIRSIESARCGRMSSALPSAPVLVLGFETLPRVGEVFVSGALTVPQPHKAQQITRERQKQSVAPDETVKNIPLVLKASEGASLEALEGVIKRLSETAPFVVVEGSVGNIYEGDVKLAESTGALIIGFHTDIDRAAENVARAKHVVMITSPIIYALEEQLAVYAKKAVRTGELRSLDVLAVFGEPKGKQRVVGGRIAYGTIKNQEPFEVWTDEKLLGAGRIINLQSGRKDVPEASADTEVGMLVETDVAVKAGHRLVFGV